jgi:hypothetical protein
MAQFCLKKCLNLFTIGKMKEAALHLVETQLKMDLLLCVCGTHTVYTCFISLKPVLISISSRFRQFEPGLNLF